MKEEVGGASVLDGLKSIENWFRTGARMKPSSVGVCSMIVMFEELDIIIVGCYSTWD